MSRTGPPLRPPGMKIHARLTISLDGYVAGPGGTRLFDRPELAGVRLERTDVIPSPQGTTHLRFALRRDG